jgi:DivIVA domain-containing protein
LGVSQDDPEARVAELERRLAQTRVARPAFSEASRSQGGYHRNEVDAFLDRVEATLRDPMAAGGVTPADLDDVAFSQPPIGKRGYAEGQVDAYLDLLKIELTRRPAGQRPDEPSRCLLYRHRRWDPPTPGLAMDVSNDVIRVIDLTDNALVASASRAEVTASPAQYGGGPVLVVGIPGMPALTIEPHIAQGFSPRTPSSRLAGKVKSKKPDFLVTDEEWLTLVEIFPVELPELSTPRKVTNHLLRFIEEQGPHAPTTWRTPLLFGLMIGVPGAIYMSAMAVTIGVILLIVAAIAWRFGWEI